MRTLFALALCLLLGPLAAQAGSANPCGSPFNPVPVIQPVQASPQLAAQDPAIDCFMWQTMVYLNWPAQPGQRGVPNPQAKLGDPGPTVWQTYKDYNEVYLPGGQQPAPWNDNFLTMQRLELRGMAAPRPSIRLLNSTSKVFGAANSHDGPMLDEIEQAQGGVLYDQNNQPVYYEMLVNEVNFQYIYTNQLYNSAQQNRYAQAKGIVLPSGSIELKAAWKVLTPEEASPPLRFLTARALLPGSQVPVTMGLVGLHVFQMPSSDFNQGFWATFSQVDNAPTLNGSGQPHYSFNNPQCRQCAVNDKTSKPTQVVQVFANNPDAQTVNAFMQDLIQQQAPNSALQYYQLIDVQWPNSPKAIGQPGAETPAPNGTPNTSTLINPVLETFLQKNAESCLGCHVYAGVAASAGSSKKHYQASFSFLFRHAQAPSLQSNLKSLAQQVEEASAKLQQGGSETRQ